MESRTFAFGTLGFNCAKLLIGKLITTSRSGSRMEGNILPETAFRERSGRATILSLVTEKLRRTAQQPNAALDFLESGDAPDLFFFSSGKQLIE